MLVKLCKDKTNRAEGGQASLAKRTSDSGQASPIRFTPNEGGQALVVVLLIMSVVLTIALSVVSRSITDVSVSQKQEESLRAFSAAEAGVEKALIAGTGSTGTLLEGGASFSTTVTGLAEGTSEFVIPLKLDSGDAVSAWFVSHDVDGNLECSGTNPCFTGNRVKICWGDPNAPSSTATTPALEVAFIYALTPGDYSTARVVRGAYDPYTSRRTDNLFEAPEGTCTMDDKTFPFSKDINLNSLGIPSSVTGAQNGLQQARIRLIYNTDQDHQVGISVNFPGNSPLPKQGSKIESTGQSGEATRRVLVNRLYSDLPPVFDFGLFSGAGNLSK